MEQRIVECVPNFSEGRDREVIRQIASAIGQAGGVKVLDVDPGEATNRTVVTFVGSPEAVVEAAFQGVKRAAELIDMRRHKGAHPRMGATDVLPLIPISGITLEECAALSRDLAKRIADELRIPTYCYEAAAFRPERKNLAVCRAGEYEALPEKLAHADSAPDFGARPYDEGVARTGVALVALSVPGCMRGLPSASFTILPVMGLPSRTGRRKADARGVRVTGTEIVGLVPKRALVEAGKYFLRKQHRSTGIAEEEIVRTAIKSMGLGDLKPFVPEEKVIEYLLEAEVANKRLIDMTCKAFAHETASESPAPGGGSISAYMGALGAALGAMVANLSAHKAGWDERWEEFSDWADRGQALLSELLHLVDEDTAAFNRIMDVFAMPKSTDEEKAARSEALQAATLYATQVPLRTMKAAVQVFDLVQAMAAEGNPNSVSDAGVGALAARSAVLGACLNVKINAAGLKDRAAADALVAEAEALAAEADRREREVLAVVESKIQ